VEDADQGRLRQGGVELLIGRCPPPSGPRPIPRPFS
jgi:hypothetical protein